ncbi:hypothetical protein DIPPA_06677 [Diplonema papillatum]|nr:hypothetical protein DIPPA_06677 [Diplonema papillatum]
MQLTVSASPLPEYAGAYASCGENVWGKGDERIYLAKGFWVLGTAADQREGIGWIASCDEAGDRMPWEVARWRYFAEGAECWAEVGGLVVQRCGDSADGARVPWCVTGAGGAIVRDGISMRSRVVQKLAKGAVVFVLEVQGRRARITEPPGWMSTAASTGESILSPLQTSGPRGNSFPYPAPASSLGSSPPGFVRSPAARAASTHATHFSSANRSITTPASHPTSAPMSPLLGVLISRHLAPAL